MPHFLPIPSNDFSSWLLSNYPSKLWTVDEDYELSGHLDFPCSTEDLASELCKVNRILQVMAPDHIGALDLSTLDRAVIHHPTSTEHITYISLYLRWEEQTPEETWILSECSFIGEVDK